MNAIHTLAPAPASVDVDWPLPTTFDPRPFQLEGVARGLRQHLQLDIGLGGGKTTISLAIAEARQAQCVLVTCPRRVIAVWSDELAEHAARDWVVWAGEVVGRHGKPLKNPSVARRCEALIEAYKKSLILRRPFMAVVNYEAIAQKQMNALLLGTPWDMFVGDESHKLAGAAGVISKRIAKVTERIRGRGGRIVLQTGTFMPHSALSVYGQLRALNPEILGWSSTNFKARYAKWRIARERNICDRCGRESRNDVGAMCDSCGGRIERGEPIYQTTPGGFRIPDGVREDRQDELINRIRPHVLRVSQDDLDAQTGLVETPPQLRTIELDVATRKVYDQLERDLIAQAAGGTITAANAMVNVTRLAQVTSGYGVDAITGDTLLLADRPQKARLLADELEDLDLREPVVVFARFHHDLDQIRLVAESQGRRYGEISGRRADGLHGHLMHPDVDVVGVQPQAGGAGINLTRARLCVFYSSDWSLANYDQAKRRVLRQGQTRHVTYLHLVAEDTIDVTLFYALKKRRDTVTALLDRLNPNGKGATP
jgi:hypothetical protein